MSNSIDFQADDRFGFGENKRIYDAECARLRQEANDKTAELLRKSIPELREKLKYQEEWMKSHGYSI